MTPAPVVDAHVVVERPGFTVEVAFRVPVGGVLALLGPNGAGKTTALRALAGLLPLTRGYFALDGQIVEDAGARLRMPAEHRRIGVVFQDYLLFPTMSARDNVAFGLRARKIDRRTARSRAQTLLDQFGLANKAAARPGQLSGGQAQRVALARALVVEPRLLLLDEPLAALDAGTRMSVRTDLRGHLDAFDGATVLVTHDPLDALVLADSLIVIEDGQVVQAGTPQEVASRPRTDYVARLVGLNLLAGHATGTDVTLAAGTHLTLRRRAAPRAAPRKPAQHLARPHPQPGGPRRGDPGRDRRPARCPRGSHRRRRCRLAPSPRSARVVRRQGHRPRGLPELS